MHCLDCLLMERHVNTVHPNKNKCLRQLHDFKQFGLSIYPYLCPHRKANLKTPGSYFTQNPKCFLELKRKENMFLFWKVVTCFAFKITFHFSYHHTVTNFLTNPISCQTATRLHNPINVWKIKSSPYFLNILSLLKICHITAVKWVVNTVLCWLELNTLCKWTV